MQSGWNLIRAMDRIDVLNPALHNDIGGVQADQFIAAITQHPAQLRIGIQIAACRIGNQNSGRYMLEEHPVWRIGRLLLRWRRVSLRRAAWNFCFHSSA